MTAEEIRDIGFLQWADPLAWTEKMRGARWMSLIKKEEETFSTFVKNEIKSADIQKTVKLLNETNQINYKATYTVYNLIEIFCDSRMGNASWRFLSGVERKGLKSVNDLACSKDGYVWDIVDKEDGSESYTLSCWSSDKVKPLWSIQSVAPYVLVVSNRCYYLESKNTLWYNRLVSVDSLTGEDYKVQYEEKDPQWNLSLVKGEDGGYLVRENSGLQQAWLLSSENLKRLVSGKSGFFVFGLGQNFFFTEGRGTDNWKGYGDEVSHWMCPINVGIPESLWVSQGLIVLRKEGQRSIWRCAPNKKPHLLFKIGGDILLNPWKDTLHALCIEPGSFHHLVSLSVKKEKEKEKEKPYGISTYHTASSLDGKTVPYILVTSNPKSASKVRPSALLVIGYGAYGIPTSLNTARWRPLLEKGWSLVFALVRGGGDDSMAWANAARRFNREKAIDDFIAVIRSAQAMLKVIPDKTVIYGRSAGGILLGAAAARQPTRTVYFGALYGEVPYLDVLRTTTNPELPLTKLEYDEFGNPAERLEDLMGVLKISPIDLIPVEGYPNLFALMRTGENDKEVFAYEPVKWIVKSRGLNEVAITGKKKLLAFGKGQGHFAGSSGSDARAVDLEILDAWSQNNF